MRLVSSIFCHMNTDVTTLKEALVTMETQMADEEKIKKSADLDGYVLEAQKSEIGIEKLIKEFTPFLHRQVARFAVKHDEHQRDALFSVALSAFYEAISTFNPQRGHFYPFAERVVRARIIDHIRESRKHEGKTVSLYDDDEELQSAQSAAISRISMRNFKEERRREDLAEEIAEFKQEIAEWGITMESLAAASPKRKELRDEYYEIVAAILDNTEVMQTIKEKRYYPVKIITVITGLPQKKIERSRIFILASLIIKTGDYSLLSDFLLR